MTTKCVTITWLSQLDLSNINSGEGGGGNVVELKTYRRGRRPYASGQSVRHALREAIERSNPGCFTSTPEAPSGDIASDWLCDLFGYLNPKKVEGFDRRWSPVRCTPALGQVDAEIVTDLVLRMSDFEKEGKESKDQRLAYVQLAENIFRTGLCIDVRAVGRRWVVDADSRTKTINAMEWREEVPRDERLRRVRAVVLALSQMGDFAKQSRNAVSFTPDIFFAAILPTYTQRGLRTLELDNNQKVDVATFRVVAEDLKALGGKLYAGYTPGVIANEEEFLNACRDLAVVVGGPVPTLFHVAEAIEID